MVNYSDNEIRNIAAISIDQHIHLLTQFGLTPEWAKRIIALSTEEIAKNIEIGKASGNPKGKPLVDAMERELIIRQA
ncbi:MAG: hypothetical protein J0H18_11255 [Rhizobiales bacterium]|nr:hypothetical protein [Hyphomicrobiales bacterium]OJY06701.1 MAG: hypothetical protein BGP07_16820 [Rhizobiales bacterium 63-22]